MKSIISTLSPISRIDFTHPTIPRPVTDSLVYSEIHQIVGRVIDTRMADGLEVTVIENAGGFRIDCSPLRLRPATTKEHASFQEEAFDRGILCSLAGNHSLSA